MLNQGDTNKPKTINAEPRKYKQPQTIKMLYQE